MSKPRLLFLHELNSFVKDGRSLGILIILVIVIASSCIFGAYRTKELIERSNKENQGVVEYLSNQKNISDIRRLTYIGLRPETLSLFCPQAVEEQTKMVLLPDMMNQYNLTFIEAESSGWFNSGILNKFDFSHSVKYVLAVFSIILGAVAITKEKEAGTLKYLSAYGVPLNKIVAAKVFSGMVLVFLASILAITISLLYIEIAIIQGISENILDILVISVSAALLISLFYLVGITISLFVYSSLQAVILGISIWAAALFLLPVLSQMFAGGGSYQDVRTDQQVMTDIRREEAITAYKKQTEDINALKLRNEEVEGYWNNPEYKSISEKNHQKRKDRMRSRYEAYMAEKINLAKVSYNESSLISITNPLITFEEVIEEKAGQNLRRKVETYDRLVRYAKRYRDYLNSIEDKVKFSHQRIRNEDGKDGFLKWTFIDSNKVNLNFSDRPRFDFARESKTFVSEELVRFLASVAIWLFICTVLIIVRNRFYDIR